MGVKTNIYKNFDCIWEPDSNLQKKKKFTVKTFQKVDMKIFRKVKKLFDLSKYP